MKKYLLVLLFCVGCSQNSVRLGDVVVSSVICTSAEMCQSKLANACSKGGVIYKTRPALEILYRCN